MSSSGEKSEVKKTKMPEGGIYVLYMYPMEEWYRLIVDGDLHKDEQGFVGYFLREQGSLEAAFRGLALAVSNLEDKKLSVELISHLQKTCTSEVKDLKNNVPGSFRRGHAGKAESFSLTKDDNITEAGLVELLDMMESQKDYFKGDEHGSMLAVKIIAGAKKGSLDFDYAVNYTTLARLRKHYDVTSNKELASVIWEEITQNNLQYHYVAPSAENVKREMQKLVASYNKEITEAKKPDDKLRVIIKHVAAFERLHPFYDANIRTFVILLLNRMLMQNGFPPATFRNPNQFDAYSQEELLIELKRAMQNTIDICSGEKVIFEFNSDEIPDKYKLIYLKMIEPLAKKLEQLKQDPVSNKGILSKILSVFSKDKSKEKDKNKDKIIKRPDCS